MIVLAEGMIFDSIKLIVFDSHLSYSDAHVKWAEIRATEAKQSGQITSAPQSLRLSILSSRLCKLHKYSEKPDKALLKHKKLKADLFSLNSTWQKLSTCGPQSQQCFFICALWKPQDSNPWTPMVVLIRTSKWK